MIGESISLKSTPPPWIWAVHTYCRA